MRARNAIKKPYLTARTRLARKVWANERALLPKIFWQNVLFSEQQLWQYTLTNEYQSVVYPIPEWKRIYRKQDNAPAHNSILSKTWIAENGLEILENWPSNSPDINIIENVRNLLKKKVLQRHPKNIEELWAFCQEEFEKIPLEYIQNLHSSIPDRLNKIVLCNGKNINF